MPAQSTGDLPRAFIELGSAVLGLALLARLASRWGFSAIPLYLVGGLAFGKGGLLPLGFSEGFIHIGAEIGVLLLLFMLGLEYTGEQLRDNLRAGLPAGAADFLLNFSPGLIAGLLLGWPAMAAILLGGVTWVSSSSIIAKVLAELNRLSSPETPSVLAVLILEDIAMAIYLPLVAVLLGGGTPARLVASTFVAIATITLVLFVALRYGKGISNRIGHESDEVVLLTTFGIVLLVAGLAQRLQVSSAVGAFLVGVAVSGPIAERSRRLFAPLRDLFAAIFFFFFGLEIDPATLVPVAITALVLGLITAMTKIITGYWTAARAGIDIVGRKRAGVALVTRGEFSIVIAGLGTGVEPHISSLAAAYVLFLAVVGPILTRLTK
ncbi:MAG TPA: cation:proton antiporter [Bryobacteraceae bacterium]|jgi:CPA2 family monovalent cation:H+ antiporter-2